VRGNAGVWWGVEEQGSDKQKCVLWSKTIQKQTCRHANGWSTGAQLLPLPLPSSLQCLYLFLFVHCFCRLGPSLLVSE
jgi:hypothetical protein